MAAGVTDYGTAYQYLRDSGYNTTDANRYAKYFAESYYPAQKTRERAAKTKLGKTTAAEYDAMGANYQEVAATLADMKKNGTSNSEILSAIKDAYDNGVLNQNDYMKLTNKYRG